MIEEVVSASLDGLGMVLGNASLDVLAVLYGMALNAYAKLDLP